jgi:6-phosphogluconolactonase (cycloisomerase 2 family)
VIWIPYAPNRGHNGIAGFSVDAASGRLTAIGQVSTEDRPSAFSLDPQGRFVFAAGSETDRLASYRIDGDTGELTPLETYPVGKRPMWVLITDLGNQPRTRSAMSAATTSGSSVSRGESTPGR